VVPEDTGRDGKGNGFRGAFLNMLGVAFLEDIIGKIINLNAAQILDRLRDQVIIALKQRVRESEQKDGMDWLFKLLTGKIIRSILSVPITPW
jgi:hypothetical protein